MGDMRTRWRNVKNWLWLDSALITTVTKLPQEERRKQLQRRTLLRSVRSVFVLGPILNAMSNPSPLLVPFWQDCRMQGCADAFQSRFCNSFISVRFLYFAQVNQLYDFVLKPWFLKISSKDHRMVGPAGAVVVHLGRRGVPILSWQLLQFFPDSQFPQFSSQSCQLDCNHFPCVVLHQLSLTSICFESRLIVLPTVFKDLPRLLPHLWRWIECPFVIKFMLLGSARLSTHPIVGPAWVDRWTVSRGVWGGPYYCALKNFTSRFIEGSNIWEDMSIFSPTHKNLSKSSVSSISK